MSAFDPTGQDCPSSWCDGKLFVQNPNHPKANVRCTKHGHVMYLSNWPRLDAKALEAKRNREATLGRAS